MMRRKVLMVREGAGWAWRPNLRKVCAAWPCTSICQCAHPSISPVFSNMAIHVFLTIVTPVFFTMAFLVFLTKATQLFVASVSFVYITLSLWPAQYLPIERKMKGPLKDFHLFSCNTFPLIFSRNIDFADNENGKFSWMPTLSFLRRQRLIRAWFITCALRKQSFWLQSSGAQNSNKKPLNMARMKIDDEGILGQETRVLLRLKRVKSTSKWYVCSSYGC